MILIDRKSFLWEYLSLEQKGLISDAELLFGNSHHLPKGVSDFSYLVFPFAKAYEGFLKRLFLDMGLIHPEDYYSDDIRIGKILNPKYISEHGSVYSRICPPLSGNSTDTAYILWQTWRKYRNQVFHYFPHNFRKLTYEEAKDACENIIKAMNYAVSSCKIGPNDRKEHISKLTD